MLSLLTILGFLPGPGKALMQNWEINLVNHHADFTKFGDMLLTPQQAQRYNTSAPRFRGHSRKESPYNRWENNVIPYRISPQYSPSQKTYIGRSLLMFEQKSCFRFKERTDEADYLFIVPLDGCYSYVGKVGGRQPMSLARDCLANYIIWHELMHVIGFEHEHQRPDRDSFIKVEYDNVQPGMMINFEKISEEEVDYVDKYDYYSIMHYDSHAFGRIDKSGIRLATMIPLQTGVNIGDNYDFSPEDVKRLNRLGRCDSPSIETNEVVPQKTPSIDCVDKLPNSCAKFKASGKCNDFKFIDIAIKYCSKSCNKCAAAAEAVKNELKKQEIEEKENPCRDIIPDCKNYRDLCEDIGYIQLMHKNCALTCMHC